MLCVCVHVGDLLVYHGYTLRLERVLPACISVWAGETMEISAGTGARRSGLLGSRDDRLVLAAAVQNKLEEERSRRSAWWCCIDTHGWQHCVLTGTLTLRKSHYGNK